MNLQFLPTNTAAPTISDRLSVLENLASLRKEWEGAAEGSSLIDLSASVGLLLFDVTSRLGMSADEQTIVLGRKLYREVTIKTRGISAQ
jgi:hypothetical protein